MTTSRLHTRPSQKSESKMLLRKLRETLDRAWNTSSVSSQEEGEQYICTLCDLPVKPCLAMPSANCLTKMRANTQLDLICAAYQSTVTEAYRVCAECRKPLSSRQLKNDPLQELCPSCRAKSSRPRSKKVSTSL